MHSGPCLWYFYLLQFSRILRVNIAGRKTELFHILESHYCQTLKTQEDTPECFQRGWCCHKTTAPIRPFGTVPDSFPMKWGCPNSPQAFTESKNAKIQRPPFLNHRHTETKKREQRPKRHHKAACFAWLAQHLLKLSFPEWIMEMCM